MATNIICSIQVAILGVLPHVTFERRRLGRQCSKTVTADSGKQGYRRARESSPDLSKGATGTEVSF